LQVVVIATPFILFPLFFVAIWLLVSVMISRVGGWATLATRFRFEGEFTGPRWNWQAAQMRYTVNYNGCLTLGCDETGLYLATMPLFRFKHPPLLIPWNEITASRKRILFMDFVRLSLGNDSQIPLTIRLSLAERLSNAAGAHWPIEKFD
jgi:hypothetical protein